jgi:hypothetical protein
MKDDFQDRLEKNSAATEPCIKSPVRVDLIAIPG